MPSILRQVKNQTGGGGVRVQRAIRPHQARFGRGQLASAVDHAASARTRCTLGVMALTRLMPSSPWV